MTIDFNVQPQTQATARSHHRMRYESLNQLAFGMHRAAGRSGGAASISLASVRGVLRQTLKYGWGPCSAEFGSISRFAQDFGFEYLSISMHNGQAMCNFWLMPDDSPHADGRFWQDLAGPGGRSFQPVEARGGGHGLLTSAVRSLVW